MTKALFSLELQRNVTLSNEPFIITWHIMRVLLLIANFNYEIQHIPNNWGTREICLGIANCL